MIQVSRQAFIVDNNSMCTSYENNVSPAAVADRFGLKDIPGAIPIANLRPTNPALLIMPGYTASVLNWGFSVNWSKQPIVNARAEPLKTKPTFLPLLENRCLVPASAYFEWRHDGKKRLKNRISLANGDLMAFAGLVRGDRFTIITCPPEPTIAHIHNRMPVILGRAAETAWIDPKIRFNELEKFLSPYTESPLQPVEEVPPPARQSDLFS